MDIREEFEKSEHLKERLAICYYDENIGCYLPIRMFNYASASYLNGAWYAFQEQQNKIDAIKSKISDIYDACDENKTIGHLLDEIQELLK